ncbi:MAG: hypothetical protein ACR2HX_08995 [Pyrinomonadaceae bacterium]
MSNVFILTTGQLLCSWIKNTNEDLMLALLSRVAKGRIMQQHDETVHDIETHCRHREEINGHDLSGMIVQKGFPRLEGGLRLLTLYFATVDSAIL